MKKPLKYVYAVYDEKGELCSTGVDNKWMHENWGTARFSGGKKKYVIREYILKPLVARSPKSPTKKVHVSAGWKKCHLPVKLSRKARKS